MSPGELVGFIGGILLILGVVWRLIRAIYRLTRVGETALTRLGNVEAQLQNNGGNSARDVLDKIHAVAVQNAEANQRVEEGQQRAASLAGKAAALAATADQRIQELGELASARHYDNSQRLDRLEGAAREERIRREFYLATLRELYGIELEDPS